VDWVLEHHGRYVPIEVKWTERPSIDDAKHVATFIAEYREATTWQSLVRGGPVLAAMA
jgi:hypothetical protein